MLGAARIAPAAIVGPGRRVDGAEVVAVAARDRRRAQAFADKNGIPRVVESYEALVTDPGVDAVYNPLPNGLHGMWTLAAMAAGKHVLCEKPFTANADEARTVAAAQAGKAVVLMEAFHYRYHPLFDRVRELIATGAVGRVRHIEAALCFPLFSKKDIRWDLALAGGATMDAGCYPIHMVRHLAGSEPEVTAAQAWLRSPGVDRLMVADLRFADGVTGRRRVLDALVPPPAGEPARARRRGGDPSAEPSCPRPLPPADGPEQGGPEGRALYPATHLRLPIGSVPARRSVRGARPDRSRRCDRQHDRDRRRLPRRRTRTPRAHRLTAPRPERLGSDRDTGQKVPSPRPAARVLPSSAARSTSGAEMSPTTVSGGRTRRHCKPVAIFWTLATAPSTSVSPFTMRA